MFPAKNSCDGVYRGSLDVRFTKACDNACAFCIERYGTPAEKQNIAAMIAATIRARPKTVLILGGEPFLNPQALLSYVSGVRGYVPELIATTAIPGWTEDSWKVLHALNFLNCSICSIDNNQNAALMRVSSPHDRIETLRSLLASDQAKKVRVNINLMVGGIDTADKITEAVNTVSSWGAKSIKINELQRQPKLYVSFESAMGVHLPSPYLHGCFTDVSKLFSYSSTVKVKRSCFLVEKSIKAGALDWTKLLFRALAPRPRACGVLYESGKYFTQWQSKEIVK